MEVPDEVAALADELAAIGGVQAVVVGGSRATGEAGDGADWDLGVYYVGTPELDALAVHGQVHPPGSWGRLMNGGAWLDLDGIRVDVLLRDLDVVAHWIAEAREARFEVDATLGYVAGLPTYSLGAEVAVAHPLRGRIELDATYPERLAEVAPARWRFCRDFTLRYAAAQGERGNTVGLLGQAARATFEEAHARRCEQRRWALNEKRLLDGCGLEAAGLLLGDADLRADPPLLVDRLRHVLSG